MAKSRRKKKFRRLRDTGKRLSVWLLPLVYKLYLWFVCRTSKEIYSNLHMLWDASERGENILWAVWHQDAFFGPYVGRGHEVMTMVSKSDYGNVLSEIMRRVGFIPVRGGPKNYGKEALTEIIEYINARKGVICGLAVDGSRGPARKVQKGIVLMAQGTGVPIYPARVWAKRRLHAPTWDRTTIPLPFNQFVFLIGEPLSVSPDADKQALENYRAELERRLDELVERAESFFR